MTQDRKHDIEGVVEAVARIIDPLGWGTWDAAMAEGREPAPPSEHAVLQASLLKATAILALPTLSERQARIEGLEKALRGINRRASPDGSRTFDDAISALDWITAEARSALSSGEGGGDSLSRSQPSGEVSPDGEIFAGRNAELSGAWRSIDSAPRQPEDSWSALGPRIILGFGPDETGRTLNSCEGYWRPELPPGDNGRAYGAGWVSTLDPHVWPKTYLSPTHWMPLPEPPAEVG